jgi:Flp pilus assembly protein TadG
VTWGWARREALGDRGAVLVEFVIALVPLLMLFFNFVQLSRLATARLVVKHSAIVGARAAAVIANGKNNTPDQERGPNDAEISAGVKTALGPWWSKSGAITSVTVNVTDNSSRSDPYGWVEVKVSATYACRVPMGWLACMGKQKVLTEKFKMPHQGATYQVGE